jgi:uncharacterized membrane protein
MSVLIAGLIVFLGVHSVSIVGSSWRARVIERFGEMPWKGAYSLLSILGFILIIQGYDAARQTPVILYMPPNWLHNVALLLLAAVFPLLIAAYFPGRIKTATKHPMLAGITIWAFAHLLANGTVADVLLFGSFLIWAIADRVSMKHREPRPIPGAPPSKANDAIAIIGGLSLYLGFVLWLHEWLFGFAPVAS